MKMIFTMFHGQSLVERGFSVNADTVDTNMREQTLVARRTVYDSVANLLGQQNINEPKAVAKLDINKDVLKYCRSARNRYRQFLEEKKADEKKKIKDGSMNEVVKNKDLLEAEKRKVASFEKNIEKVSGEADLLALKAQKLSKFDLLAESNLKQKRVSELRSDLLTVKAKVQKLESIVASVN